MDPIIAGGLIKAGSSLLGGLFNKSASDKANELNIKLSDPSYARERYEAAGFNPLLWSGQSLGSVSPYMIGDSISAAGQRFSDATVQKAEYDLKKTALEQENERLQKQLERQTLLPQVGGIYDRKAPAPTTPSGRRALSLKMLSEGATPADVMRETDIPVWTLHGRHYVGSGDTSTGETFEAAGGEIAGGIGGVASVTDAISTTIKSDRFGHKMSEASEADAKHNYIRRRYTDEKLDDPRFDAWADWRNKTFLN